jgi:beta-galactosidase
MLTKQLRIILLASLVLWQNLAEGQKHTFSLGDSAFLLDGKPFLMISGEMHYPRIPAEYWRDRMKMAKAMGLNTIGTYVFWNAHEPTPGDYDFTGNNDISTFLRVAKDEGLWVVLRPSPYVCAEWEFGGYPWWLLKDSTLKVRSKDDRFITAYRNYIRELAKHIVPHLVTNGGNMLMIQIENEYGSYSNDKTYLDLNRQVFEEAGFDCTLFTCDGADKMPDGYLPGYLPAVNGLEDPVEVKKLINTFHNGKGPYYVAEWYPGWFDNWGKRHASVSGSATAQKLDKILAAGISINMYMFHGGTTRGFMNGANMNINDPYSPQVSSYDYDAPLDEAGNPTEKFYAFREVIAGYLPAGQVLPPVPPKKKTLPVDSIRLTEYANLFSDLPKPVLSASVLSFEDINQAYGLVLYRTTLRSAIRGYLKVQEPRDFAIIYINGKQVATLDRRLKEDSVLLKNIPAGAVLDILVENHGRVNYGPYLTDNRKGITRRVTFNGVDIYDWKIYRLPLNDPKALRFTSMPQSIKSQPAFYRGQFMVKEVADTWVDMRSFGKGIVFINGQNLGRYWQIGPQQTIFVPAVWLKNGTNEVIVFDELKTGHTLLPTLTGPVLNQLQ